MFALIFHLYSSEPALFVDVSLKQLVRLSTVHRSPKNWSTSTTPRTSRLWTSQGLPVKTLPSKCWMLSTPRYGCHEKFTSLHSDMELSWTSCFVMCIGDRNLFWSCVYLSSYSWSPLQLDCCGKGDDTPLFKQVAGTLCPRKSPEDFLKSQVNTKFTMDSIPV